MKRLRVGVYDSSTPSKRGGGASIRGCILSQMREASDDRVEFVRVGWQTHPGFPADRQVVLQLPRHARIWMSLRRLRWLLHPRAVLAQLRLTRTEGAASAPNNEDLQRMEWHLERTLFAHGIDLLLFLEDQEVFGGRIPYVTYVWEISRRTQPYFPETFERPMWARYERVIGPVLHRAFRIICGTETGKRQILHSYGVPDSRVKVIPFPVTLAGPRDESHPSAGPPDRPELKELPAGGYFLYPANFWPHKNHIVILEALARMAEEGLQARVVFTGADHGNLAYVRASAERLGVAGRVVFAGFVTREELARLYRNAAALVFASLIGPDNLPPLEAMASGCPVLASDIEGARDQLGPAAGYFDPFSAADLAAKLAEILRSPARPPAQMAAAAALMEACSPDRHVEKLRQACLEFLPYSRLTDWRTYL